MSVNPFDLIRKLQEVPSRLHSQYQETILEQQEQRLNAAQHRKKKIELIRKQVNEVLHKNK